MSSTSYRFGSGRPAFNPDNWLLLVADTWAELRPCDVYRLYDECAPSNWAALTARLADMRPDVAERARRDRDAISAEHAAGLSASFGKGGKL